MTENLTAPRADRYDAIEQIEDLGIGYPLDADDTEILREST